MKNYDLNFFKLQFTNYGKTQITPPKLSELLAHFASNVLQGSWNYIPKWKEYIINFYHEFI